MGALYHLLYLLDSKETQFNFLFRKRNYNETVTHTEMQMTNIFNKIYTMYKPGYMTRKIIITRFVHCIYFVEYISYLIS